MGRNKMVGVIEGLVGIELKVGQIYLGTRIDVEVEGGRRRVFC